MKSEEVYKKLLLKINKNDSNRNINLSKGNFVLIFNEQALAWLDNELKINQSTDFKNYISHLLVVDEKLTQAKTTDRFTEYSLPENLFKYENSFSVASRGKCKGRILYNWDFKIKNRKFIE